MTLYGVITAAVVRKIRAFVSEIRLLVAEANGIEQSIVSTAEAKAAIIIMDAKMAERAVLDKMEAETSKLKNELVDKISKL